MNVKFFPTWQSGVALAMFVLTGCATPADPAAMVPQDAKVRKSHGGTVDLTVAGGRETNPLGASDVSSEDFRKALETSLLRYGLFSRVIQNSNSTYRLEVVLANLKQPIAGFDMTVTAEVSWRLTDARSGHVLWEQTTTTPFKATVGDAFAGVHRLRLANEGAIRESIKKGVEHLSELSY